MKKILSLFFITAIISLFMCAAVQADTVSSISGNITLKDGDVLSECTIQGSSDSSNPVKVTLPESGTVNTTSAKGKNCITIEGNVEIKGSSAGMLTHHNETGVGSSNSIIYIGEGATLTISDATIKGNTTGNVSSSGDNVSYGIYCAKGGTLKINNTTITGIYTSATGFVFASVVYIDNGTLDVDKADITDSNSRGGGAAIYITGADSKATVNNTTIHKNQCAAINLNNGSLSIDNSLMTGSVILKGKLSGLLSSGYIASDSLAYLGDTIKDEDTGLSVASPKTTPYYLSAVSSHTITTTKNDEESTGIFTGGQWHFYPNEHKHSIELNPDNLMLSLAEGGETSGTIEAEIICPNHKNVTNWQFAAGSLTNVVKINTIKSNANAINVTALNAGTTIIEAVTADNLKAQCTVTVAPDDRLVITRSTTLVGGQTYKEIVIDPEYEGSPLNVVIPSQGITVKSGEGKDCITVMGGNVQLLGGAIYHMNDEGVSSNNIINIKNGATLTLTNVGIYGTSKEKADADMNHDTVTAAETVNNGIYNSGVLFMQTNVNITRIHADHAQDNDGVIYNAGQLTMMDGVFIHDNYSCYAIYPENENCTQTVNGGVIVGVLPEGIKFDGAGKDGVGIIDGTVGDTLTIAKNGFVQRTVKMNKAMYENKQESLVTPLKNTVTTEVKTDTGSNIYIGIHAGNTWHFTDSVKSETSYVKMQGAPATVSGVFAESHINKNGTKTSYPENLGDKYSISTAFEDGEDISYDSDVYVLCDVIIPQNSASYIKCRSGQTVYGDKNEFKVTRETTLSDSEGVICAVTNANEYTLKVKYKVPAGSNKQNNGLIVDDLYAPNAIAYIRTCDQANYDAATEYEVANNYSDNEAATTEM